MHLVALISIVAPDSWLDGHCEPPDLLISSLLVVHTTSHRTTMDGIYDTIHGEEPYDCQTLRLCWNVLRMLEELCFTHTSRNATSLAHWVFQHRSHRADVGL